MVARTRVRNLSAEVFESGRPPDLAGWNDPNVYEGEGDCTSETGWGQFSIFGAIEEKALRIFADSHG